MNTQIRRQARSLGQTLFLVLMLGGMAGESAAAERIVGLTPGAQSNYLSGAGMGSFGEGSFFGPSAPGYEAYSRWLKDAQGQPRTRIRFSLGGPPLGCPLPPVPPEKPGEAAAHLRSYVAEPFFAPLSAFWQDGTLSKRRSGMLERYDALKGQVVKNLSDEIGSIQAAKPTERRERLEAFAQRQAAEVAQVEELAEAIRQDLFRKTLVDDGVDWEGTRNWHLGDPNRKSVERDQFEVLQAAAAFAQELSLAQRELLQEAAMELVDHARAAAAPADAAKPVTFFYFTPSTSRIRMPLEMPDALRQHVDTYRELKDGLKEELRATVFGNDKSDKRVRTAAFSELREAQSARLVRLQSLAEEIRVGLVGCVYPDEPPTSLIPPSLAPQIAEYLKAKVEAQRAFVAKLAEVRAAVPQGQAEIVPYDRGYQIQVSVSGSLVGAGMSVLNSLPEFHEAQARRYAELLAQKKALVRALNESPGHPLETAGRSVDALLQEFAVAQAQRETWNKYWMYRQAVLEPGLSDGQRRLLYRSAVESLVGPYVR